MFEELTLERILSPYLDLRMISNIGFLVLILLLMLVMNALQVSGLLGFLGQKLIGAARDERRLALFLCTLVFVSSAFLTNDVVLLGLVPLTIAIGVSSGINVVRIIIFEGIAANAGSLLTPFGNPQNIYISVYYGVGIQEFVSKMLYLWLVSFAILVVMIHFTIERRKLAGVEHRSPDRRIAVLGLIALSVVILYFAGILPILLIAPIVLILLVSTGAFRSIVRMLDLKLFGLFVAIAFVTYLILGLWTVELNGLPLLLSATGLSQFISNVPAAFVLSGGADWTNLALGVNIGGSGTLISSIATVIAYRFAKKYDANTSALEFMKWGAVFCMAQILLMIPAISLGLA